MASDWMDALETEHQSEWIAGFVHGWEDCGGPANMPRCSMPAAVEAQQLRSCGSRAAEDGAAPEDFAVVESFGLLQGPGQDAPLPVGAHVMSDSRDVCCACRFPSTTEDPLIRCTAPRCTCMCHYGCGNVYPEQHTVKWFCTHCDENGDGGMGPNDWEPDYSPGTGPPYRAIFEFPNHPRLEVPEGATSRMPSSEIDCSHRQRAHLVGESFASHLHHSMLDPQQHQFASATTGRLTRNLGHELGKWADPGPRA